MLAGIMPDGIIVAGHTVAPLVAQVVVDLHATRGLVDVLEFVGNLLVIGRLVQPHFPASGFAGIAG